MTSKENKAPLINNEAPPAYSLYPTQPTCCPTMSYNAANHSPGAPLNPGYPVNLPPNSVALAGQPVFSGQVYESYQGGGMPAVYQQPIQQNVIIIGGCPSCRVGTLEDDFSCLAICCAVLFFPVGLLFCLALKEKKCSNCGAIF